MKAAKIVAIVFGIVIFVLLGILIFVPSAQGPTTIPVPSTIDGHMQVLSPTPNALVSSPVRFK